MKVVSLFSGCGGLDLGFKKAGFNIVWANDVDNDACLTYKKNIGDHIICKNIYDINGNFIPNADILIGGFPCLGFTIAQGKNRKLDCEYNKLFLEYARILKIKQPKYFLVENVTGIKSGKIFSEYFDNTIIETFKKSGNIGDYKIKYKVLNSSDYGVPQNRKRIIIIGTRSDVYYQPDFPKPLLLINKLSLKDAIYDLPLDYDNLISNHTGSQHKVKINGYLGNRKLQWDEPSPTITGRGSRTGGAVIHPHPSNTRRLSVRECARIQSFPDNFYFIGSNGSCYSQIGNAVPPIMSFFMANKFRQAFNLKEIQIDEVNWKLPFISKLIENTNAQRAYNY